jgi:hypothetical protein
MTQPSEPAYGRKTDYKKMRSKPQPKQLEFKNGEWIDRQHGNKIQVPTAP